MASTCSGALWDFSCCSAWWHRALANAGIGSKLGYYVRASELSHASTKSGGVFLSDMSVMRTRTGFADFHANAAGTRKARRARWFRMKRS